MIDFPRYLAAKKSVDDRALNRAVWEHLKAALLAQPHQRPLRVLELGCGIGTMVERLLAWGLSSEVDYLGIDSQAENLHVAANRLRAWGRIHGYQVASGVDEVCLTRGGVSWQVRFLHADATTFQASTGFYDLLLANAFLDLMDVPRFLPIFARWLAPQGLFYFTINFDGATIFEPVVDEAREDRILALYHQSMDERRVEGQKSGDSRAGRHLFQHLRAVGAQIWAAGASDWVVYPGPDGYPADEAYFLHCILNFFEDSLKDHPELMRGDLESWLNERRGQVECTELVYIAHQLDFLGTFRDMAQV